MRGVRPRWSRSALTTRTRPERLASPFVIRSRSQASAAAPVEPFEDAQVSSSKGQQFLSEKTLTQLPSPPVSAAQTSAKLAALHARLSLPSRLPLETLARTLVDSSADPSSRFNNKSFAILGNDLLGYYTSEYITCQYPRLPLAVVFAAMYAYVGPKSLRSITREWGVENAAEPGGEVDPGLLQYRHVPPEPKPQQSQPKLVDTQPEGDSNYRRSLSARVLFDDEFGELKTRDTKAVQDDTEGVTAETASANFVRAVMGAVYLHAGRAAAKSFYRDHFMSRQLNMANLFQFKFPTRDLSRLCAREGFQSPVARIESETGRRSRHPVYVVGVYSGSDKLGEGVGASLDEARTTAAVAALKGWYLYSPPDFRLPSETEEPNHRPWIPLLVDPGDIVV